MKARIFSPLFLALIAASLASIDTMAQQPGPECKTLASQIQAKPELLEGYLTLIVNVPTCFVEASRSSPETINLLKPARASLWTALSNYSNGQQQGSSLGSAGSTNAVSKPTGPTSIIEELGGLNVSSGTSSMTFQLSPGKSLTSLALNSIIDICDSVETSGCVSSKLVKALTPLTLKLTANTTTSAQSVNGTATTPTSSSPSQPVSFSSLGSSLPSFSGLTVQYAILTPPSSNVATSKTPQNAVSSSLVSQYTDELTDADKAVDQLERCKAYSDWMPGAQDQLKSKYAELKSAVAPRDITTSLAIELTRQYQTLAAQLAKSPACIGTIKAFNVLFQAIMAAEAYDNFGSSGTNSAVPELSLEYDLNTPLSKPSYSSIKASGTLQWPKKTASSQTSQLAQSLKAFTASQAATLFPGTTKPTCATDNAKAPTGSASGSTAAAATPPFSFTAMIGADLYNSTPPSPIPSASSLRDIQAGGEIDYRLDFRPKGCGLWQQIVGKIGSVTTAGSYYYQDQTSPSILTGPPSTITFTGLPSGTTSVYAQRGVINLAQLRLGFGTGSKVNFPIAATYSNRTELILHPTWGLQFGLSYNLTSLFSPNSSQ